ncbi:hypothetical protein BDZ97DRAFT_1911957 [Flammula alnicola]|nr:hypothetical protein BDZ97DRAFT_1911957 [Flammula alnicola]
MSNSVINFNAPQYAEAAIATQHTTQIIRSIIDQIDRLEPITLESPRGTLIGVGLAKGSKYAFAEFSLLNTQLSTIRGNTSLSMTGDAYLHLQFHKNDRCIWDFFVPLDNNADPCMSEDAAGATDLLARDRANANIDSVSAIRTAVLIARDLVDAANHSVSASTTTSAHQDESLPLHPFTHNSQDDSLLTQTADTSIFSSSILGASFRTPQMDWMVSYQTSDEHWAIDQQEDAARATADAPLAPHSPISRSNALRSSALSSHSFNEPTHYTQDDIPFAQTMDTQVFHRSPLDGLGDTAPAAVDGPLAPHLSNPRSIALRPSASHLLPYDGTKKHSLDDEPCLHPSDYDAIVDRMPHGEIDSDTMEGWVARTLDKAREGELTSQHNTAAQEVAQTTADGPLTVRSLDDCPITVCSLDDHSITAHSLEAHPLTTGSPNSHLPPSNTTTDSTQVDTIHIRTSDFDSTMECSLYSDIDSDSAEGRIMGIAPHGNSALQPSTTAQENTQPAEGPTLTQVEAESASQLSAATLDTARAALESLFGPRSIASRPRQPLPTRFPLNRPPTPPFIMRQCRIHELSPLMHLRWNYPYTLLVHLCQSCQGATVAQWF